MNIKIQNIFLGLLILPVLLSACDSRPLVITTLAPPTVTKLPTFAPTPAPSIGSTQISKADGMTQMYVPAGFFTMGSDSGEGDEKPVHAVTLDAFGLINLR